VWETTDGRPLKSTLCVFLTAAAQGFLELEFSFGWLFWLFWAEAHISQLIDLTSFALRRLHSNTEPAQWQCATFIV
jgi:hypothetical protein